MLWSPLPTITDNNKRPFRENHITQRRTRLHRHINKTHTDTPTVKDKPTQTLHTPKTTLTDTWTYEHEQNEIHILGSQRYTWRESDTVKDTETTTWNINREEKYPYKHRKINRRIPTEWLTDIQGWPRKKNTFRDKDHKTSFRQTDKYDERDRSPCISKNLHVLCVNKEIYSQGENIKNLTFSLILLTLFGNFLRITGFFMVLFRKTSSKI